MSVLCKCGCGKALKPYCAERARIHGRKYPEYYIGHGRGNLPNESGLYKCRECGECKPLPEMAKLHGSQRAARRCKKCRSLAECEMFRSGKRDLDKALNRRIQSAYGITLNQYNSMYDACGGRCEICGTACGKMSLGASGETPSLPTIAIDHDHKTGKVRGLLCQGCNRGVGVFKDEASLLRLAACYLDSKS